MRQLITYFHQTLARDRPAGSMQTIYGYRHYIKDLTYYVQFARVTLICLCLNTTTQINHLLSQVGIYIPNMHIIIVNFTHKNYCLIKITTYIFIYILRSIYIFHDENNPIELQRGEKKWKKRTLQFLYNSGVNGMDNNICSYQSSDLFRGVN